MCGNLAMKRSFIRIFFDKRRLLGCFCGRGKHFLCGNLAMQPRLHSHFWDERRLPRGRVRPRKTLHVWQPRNEAQGFIRIFGKNEGCPGCGRGRGKCFMCGNLAMKPRLHSHFLEGRRLPGVQMWPRKTLFSWQPRNEAELHSHFL